MLILTATFGAIAAIREEEIRQIQPIQERLAERRQREERIPHYGTNHHPLVVTPGYRRKRAHMPHRLVQILDHMMSFPCGSCGHLILYQLY